MSAEHMPAAHASRPPHWYGIPVRVALITFIGTLLTFAVSLLVSIIVTIVASEIRGMHPQMNIAYRYLALPVAAVAGAIIFVLAAVMEVRHYRQTKALSAIERLG